jgi:hypothetical protein
MDLILFLATVLLGGISVYLWRLVKAQMIDLSIVVQTKLAHV